MERAEDLRRDRVQAAEAQPEYFHGVVMIPRLSLQPESPVHNAKPRSTGTSGRPNNPTHSGHLGRDGTVVFSRGRASIAPPYSPPICVWLLHPYAVKGGCMHNHMDMHPGQGVACGRPHAVTLVRRETAQTRALPRHRARRARRPGPSRPRRRRQPGPRATAGVESTHATRRLVEKK